MYVSLTVEWIPMLSFSIIIFVLTALGHKIHKNKQSILCQEILEGGAGPPGCDRQASD